ncbi:MAG: thioredoxin domain-containing protein [Candidatus Kerfeldbacteria bacterium]|nr:thioredoxin domain-containing protein [Candidatus Kerfeldbacteria bacterium]
MYKKIVGALLVVIGLVILGFIALLLYIARQGPIQNASSIPQTLTRTTAGTPFIPTAGDDPTLGNPAAPIVIISFADYQCPYSKAAEEIMVNLVQRYPDDLLFVYRDFPLYTHPQAEAAAQAAECADEQNQFWPYNALLFEQQDNLAQAGLFATLAEQLNLDLIQFNDCVAASQTAVEVQHDLDEALLAGLNATPTYFVNGTKLVGVRSEADWVDTIETILSD